MNRHDALRAAFGSLLLCCANSAAADGNLALAFTPDPAARGEVTGAGCYPDPGLAHGLLTPSSEAGPCETGLIGYDTGAGGFAGDVTLETAAIFESAELGSALAVGGPAVLTVRYSVTTGGMAIAGQDTASTLNYELREKYSAGHYTTIASGAAFELNPGFDRGSASFQVPEYSLSPGSRLQVLLTASGPSETRIAFGGDYSESGITLATPEAKSAGLLGAGGMSPLVLLLLSAVAAFFRFSGVRSTLGALLIFGAGTTGRRQRRTAMAGYSPIAVCLAACGPAPEPAPGRLLRPRAGDGRVRRGVRGARAVCGGRHDRSVLREGPGEPRPQAVAAGHHRENSMTTHDGIRSLRPAAAALALLAAAAAPAAEAGLFLAFTPDPALEQDAGSLSPEGCYNEPAVARGALTASSSTTNCHSGQWGSDSNVDNCGGGVCEPFDQSEAIFDSAPLSAPLQLGGTATLAAYYYAAYERGPGGTNDPDLPTTAYLEYAIEDFTPGAIGGVTIARGRAFQLNGQAGGVHRGEATFSIASYAIPAGHILRVRLTSQAAPDGRLLFGGAPLASTPAFGARSEYSDAGITFGTPDSKSDGGALGAGSMPGGPLALLALLALLRGRRFQPRARANSFMYSTSVLTPASGIAL